MLKSLCDNITAVAKSDKKDLHKYLVELSDQVLAVYENDRLFSAETKAETVNPLVRKFVWVTPSVSMNYFKMYIPISPRSAVLSGIKRSATKPRLRMNSDWDDDTTPYLTNNRVRSCELRGRIEDRVNRTRGLERGRLCGCCLILCSMVARDVSSSQ